MDSWKLVKISGQIRFYSPSGKSTALPSIPIFRFLKVAKPLAVSSELLSWFQDSCSWFTADSSEHVGHAAPFEIRERFH